MAMKKGRFIGRPFDRISSPGLRSSGNFTAGNNHHCPAWLSFIANDFHGLPVIGKFFATVKAYHVDSGYRSRFTAALRASGSYGKTATFVRTAKNKIEQAHTPTSAYRDGDAQGTVVFHLSAREPHHAITALSPRWTTYCGVKLHSRRR